MPTYKYPRNTTTQLKEEIYGDPIPGSSLFRSYCPRCQGAIRISKGDVDNNKHPFCQECNPKHRGCSSPSSPWDPDAMGSTGVSTQHDYGNIPGN